MGSLGARVSQNGGDLRTFAFALASILCCCCCYGPSPSEGASSCLSPKFTIVPNHSACLSPSPYAAASLPPRADVQVSIVSFHNGVRREARAADMQAMVWDDELAAVAQRWANNCQFAHDGGAQRSVPGKYAVGQNLAYGFVDWTAAMKAWADERAQFVYGGTSALVDVVGHYTQMVWSNTSRVGCGATYCTNLKATLFVCDYAPAGNILPLTNRPYARPVSRPGELCGSSLKDGLCDCRGQACFNGGELNLQSCTCTCSAPQLTKPNCNLNCAAAAADPFYCSWWPESACTTYFNVPYMCPNKCKWCPLAGM